jgi:drug/metabolite transporter (DMT)-like permease
MNFPFPSPGRQVFTPPFFARPIVGADAEGADGLGLHATLLVVALLWGLAFVAIKMGLADMSWITLTILRLGLACVFFGLYLAVSKDRHRPLERRDVPMLALLGFLGFTGYHTFLNFGEEDPFTTAGTASLVIASAPAFMAVLAIALLKERVTGVRAGGLALAFGGLAFMLLQGPAGSAFEVRLAYGAAFVVPSAVMAALYAVLGKPYAQKYRPFDFVAYTLFFGTLLTLPLVGWNAEATAREVLAMPLAAWLAVLFLAFFPTFVAYGLWFRALRRMDASAIGAYVYLSTLIAVVSGVLLLGEAITLPIVIGGILVILGVYLAERRAPAPLPAAGRG